MAHVLDDLDARERYLALLRDGDGAYNAAKRIGTRHSQVKRYLVTHPDFAEECADAAGEPVDNMLMAAYQLAMGQISVIETDRNGNQSVYSQPPDLRAIEFLMPKLDAERFGNKVQHEHQHQVTLETSAELAELTERLMRRRGELEAGVIIDVPAPE